MSDTTFPRQHARTRRFTLGVPRDFSISEDGARILFVRSRNGADPVGCLWRFDVATGEERLVVDPRSVLGGSSEELPEEEKARRERARESSEGIVRFATDDAGDIAVFTLSGRLFVFHVDDATVRELPVETPVLEPRPDPTGRLVAYVSGGAVRLVDVEGKQDRLLIAPEAPDVGYGLAEFVAAEEIDRAEGYWWAPDGELLLVARVDTSPVRRMFISDPAHPLRRPAEVPYPFAGTDNALVTLHVVSTDGARTEVEWDRRGFEYVARVHWSEHGLLLAVQNREQTAVQLLDVDPASGRTSLRAEDLDEHWVALVEGVPARTEDGAVVWTADRGGARRLLVDGEPVTPPELQVRAILDIDGATVIFSASSEPTEIEAWEWSAAGGATPLQPGGAGPDEDREGGGRAGVRSARRRGGTTILSEQGLSHDGTRVSVFPANGPVSEIASVAEVPVVRPNLQLLRAGERQLRTALLLPTGYEVGSAKLPVLLDPYGGPGAQRVVATRGAFLSSQWFADQGFAVVVADGRGTPGRGSEWERAVFRDLAGPVLEDQVSALDAAAESCADLDLERVAIRGWSFGGYLAALAVLRRPDVFHAAVAGAPVTDFALYDTHYTERYLGTPDADASAYARCSLLGEAASLSRPLMIIHGLADDNVVVAHTLRFSALLTAAGRPHTVLPLSGVTHMTPQEEVAENLLLLQLEFLRRALGLGG